MRMTITPLALAAAFAVALAPAAALAESSASSDRIDLAFDALSQGRTSEAIQQLRLSQAMKDGEPAALINLGSAYAKQGQVEKARWAYRRALTSDIRADVQLSDGTWTDSRRAALMALEKLNARSG
jgi:Tfp pilus assembly protein PilF